MAAQKLCRDTRDLTNITINPYSEKLVDFDKISAIDTNILTIIEDLADKVISIESEIYQLRSNAERDDAVGWDALDKIVELTALRSHKAKLLEGYVEELSGIANGQ